MNGDIEAFGTYIAPSHQDQNFSLTEDLKKKKTFNELSHFLEFILLPYIVLQHALNFVFFVYEFLK